MCFTKDTLVYTAQGLLEISKIKVGDKVFSYNQANGHISLNTVLNVFVNRVKTKLTKIQVNGNWITSTSSHPFYNISNGWVKAKDLNIGDYLLNVENEAVKVEDIQGYEENEKISVYNLEVENNHNYFVGENNILVHNAPDVPDDGWCYSTDIKIYGTKVNFD